MKNKMPWVKWSPVDFLNGVVGLDPNSIAAYAVIINLIYDNGGPIRSDPSMMKKIARRIGMRFDNFQKAISVLSTEGKLVIVDGVMSNARCEVELGSRAAKVAKLVSNFSGGQHVDEKNGKHFNGHDKKMVDQIAAETATDKNQNQNRGEEIKRAKVARPPRPSGQPLESKRIDPRRSMSDQNLTYGRARGLTRKEIEFNWQRFVRYYAGVDHKARNAKSPDWDIVWESWVLRQAADLNREPLAEADDSHVEIPREVWERSMKMWMESGIWHPTLGPEPGQKGCLAPADLVRPS